MSGACPGGVCSAARPPPAVAADEAALFCWGARSGGAVLWTRSAGGELDVFHKLLIANRGEIACRVARAARALGVRSVAVYSDADERALHVEQCDEAVRLGPAPARESYLDAEKILAAAKRTGAEA
ncbi:MAG TPA: biotin carboxylase N-terminal domain-containing protein, partial [Myxococcales bacterium]|nr:biotin carboxylase N-terminal domain-containing protein [Myxococcales bacterium]